MEDEAYRISIGKIAAQYVAGHTGATETIVGFITPLNLPEWETF